MISLTGVVFYNNWFRAFTPKCLSKKQKIPVEADAGRTGCFSGSACLGFGWYLGGGGGLILILDSNGKFIDEHTRIDILYALRGYIHNVCF